MHFVGILIVLLSTLGWGAKSNYGQIEVRSVSPHPCDQNLTDGGKTSSHLVYADQMVDPLIDTITRASTAVMEVYQRPNSEIDIETKKDDSPLTEADLLADKIIYQQLSQLWPDIPIISEETIKQFPYERRKDWKTFWLIDPIDGTKEFIKKNGEFTVNIALIHEQRPVLGLIAAPALDLLYIGMKGHGTFKMRLFPKSVADRVPERLVSAPASPNVPLVIARSRSHVTEHLMNFLHENQIEMAKPVPVGSSLKFAYVAEGIVDIYPRAHQLNEWDAAAGDAVYTYSASKDGDSSLRYNSPTMKVTPFILGF